MKKFIIATLLFIISIVSFSQEDSTQPKQMDEVVITATRTERKLGNVTVPVQLISAKIIQQSGSVRLNDILQEQTGLFITSGGSTSSVGGGVFGNAVQIQGLSPDYTLILLDGEPIIGRQGGVIDLARLTVNNIKKIEIVKGPSSSLYGSEAMGGVVNIITEQPKQNRIDASLRYGRFNTMDANITAAMRKQKWGLQLSGNRNSSDGYDLDKETVGKTADPYKNYTGQLKFIYQPSVKTKISLSGRYNNEVQGNFFGVEDMSGGSLNVAGNAILKDLNINPVITQHFSSNIRSSLRLYFSRFQYQQNLESEIDRSAYYHDFFQQAFYRAEDQTDINLPQNNFLSIGGGLVAEKLNTTRYAGKRSNDIKYFFVQNEWRPGDALTIIGGLRYDDNSAYDSRFSPKLAAHYKVNNKLRINASYGAGFKAPDFRQLFLNFTNNAGGGYTIYGANEVTLQLLQQQQQQGILTEISPRANQLALLKPEISKGLNAGFRYDVNDKWNATANFFRNDINNLIVVNVIAHKSNGADVYSYFNVSRAFTEGSELNVQYIISKNLQLSGGYQFLITADKDELEKIKNGNEYARDIQTGTVHKMTRSEYAGLSNRSEHMANAKLFYDNDKSGWSGSLRMIYRSRWGTNDEDGNGIINRSDEFAKGSLLINISGARQIKAFRLQAGIDNLFNYKDVLNLPGQPGIQPYISISYSFIKNHK